MSKEINEDGYDNSLVDRLLAELRKEGSSDTTAYAWMEKVKDLGLSNKHAACVLVTASMLSKAIVQIMARVMLEIPKEERGKGIEYLESLVKAQFQRAVEYDETKQEIPDDQAAEPPQPAN